MQTAQTFPSLPDTREGRKHLKTEIVSDVCHCSSVAQLYCHLTMFIHCELVILILALTLDGQAHSGEIYGGNETVPHSRPYMVLLQMVTQDGKTKYCGGFLLNEDFVMTAAHCQASNYTVLLGVHNFHKANQIHRSYVEKTFPHTDFNISQPQKNDIMLLKLTSKAKFNNNVRAIALAGKDDGSLPKSCVVSGWGRTNTTSKLMSLTLMEVNVTLTEPCPEEKTYCTVGIKGPRKGDSGGPLVCEDGRAYGVVSASKPQPADVKPVNIYCYAKIPDFRNWIDEIMKHNGSSNRSHT